MQDSHTATVVIVDDNVDNLFITLQLLRTKLKGLNCSGWGTGARFFTWLDQEPDRQIDLILLDIQMPEMDGFAVLRQIRTRPALERTKVVAVTAHVMSADVEHVRTAGFDGLIGKPLHPERFPQQVRRILEGEMIWMPR